MKVEIKLYSFEEAMTKIGYKKEWRNAITLCKECGILDKERSPLPPYKYLGLFEVKNVRVPAGFNVKQPFLTEKMVNILWGMFILDTRNKAEAVRRENNSTQKQSRKMCSTTKRPRTPT